MSGRRDRTSEQRPTVLRPLVAANVPMFRSRLRWTYLILVALVLALVIRLAFIQIADGAYYSKLSVEQVRTTVALPPLRGGIFDRHGNILAISSPTALVVADDFQITQPDTEAAALAPYLKMKTSVLARKLHEHSGYVIVDTPLDRHRTPPRAGTSRASSFSVPPFAPSRTGRSRRRCSETSTPPGRARRASSISTKTSLRARPDSSVSLPPPRAWTSRVRT